MLLKIDCLSNAVGEQPHTIPLINFGRKWALSWWWWWWWVPSSMCKILGSGNTAKLNFFVAFFHQEIFVEEVGVGGAGTTVATTPAEYIHRRRWNIQGRSYQSFHRTNEQVKMKRRDVVLLKWHPILESGGCQQGHAVEQNILLEWRLHQIPMDFCPRVTNRDNPCE